MLIAILLITFSFYFFFLLLIILTVLICLLIISIVSGWLEGLAHAEAVGSYRVSVLVAQKACKLIESLYNVNGGPLEAVVGTVHMGTACARRALILARNEDGHVAKLVDEGLIECGIE